MAIDPAELRRGEIFGAAFFGAAALFNGAKWLAGRLETKVGSGVKKPGDERAATAAAAKAELTIARLRELEWRRFEELVEGYFRADGFKPQRTRAGMGDAHCLYLYRESAHRPEAYVHFKPGGYVVSGSEVPAEGPLVSDVEFLSKFNALRQSARVALITEVFRGDFATPTCPKCEIKMILREEEPAHWGCRNFPRCHQTLPVSRS